MNILNLAIDYESVEIVNYLCELIKQLPHFKSMLTHKYSKDMQTIHQVMSLGELRLINLIAFDMKVDIHKTM
jgi:hypothetical protein